MTGTTTGQIVDIDHTTTLGNCLCPGMFVIIPNEELPFAASGDSGAPVFDLDTDHVIGLVCGSSEKYFIQGQWHSTVVFGIRLDNCIEYVAKTYNLILHFKEHVGEKITQVITQLFIHHLVYKGIKKNVYVSRYFKGLLV